MVQRTYSVPVNIVSGSLADCGCCGGGTVSTDCCEEELPATLTMTLTNDVGGCPGFDGQETDLTYNAATGRWEGTITACGSTVDVSFGCFGDFGSGPVFTIAFFEPGTDTNPGEGCFSEAWDQLSVTCDPFECFVASAQVDSVEDGCDCCPDGGNPSAVISE